MNDFTLFLGKFLRHGTAIASLAPSSRWLAAATIADIDWSRPRVIVELGAGTGPITRALAERAEANHRLLILERDPDFAAILRDRFHDRPNFDLIEGDVGDLDAILRDRGIDRVDHYVSGLPTPSLPVAVRDEMLRVVARTLTPEGSFNQITEMPWVYYRMYRRLFQDVRFIFEPRNLPPAGVYRCRGVRAGTAS